MSQLKASRMLDRAVRSEGGKYRGFYHVFACDSVIDARGEVRLLECNGFPAESEQWRIGE